MIFDKEVYKEKNIILEFFSRFKDSMRSHENLQPTQRELAPRIVSEVQDKNALALICSFDAINVDESVVNLDLLKCRLCGDCLEVEGVSLEEVMEEELESSVINMKLNLNQN